MSAQNSSSDSGYTESVVSDVTESVTDLKLLLKAVSLLVGIGVGMLCVSTLVCLYYNVIIAWTFYYLGSSFQSPLPWSCDALANAALCNGTFSNSSSGKVLSPTELFWK